MASELLRCGTLPHPAQSITSRAAGLLAQVAVHQLFGRLHALVLHQLHVRFASAIERHAYRLTPGDVECERKTVNVELRYRTFVMLFLVTSLCAFRAFEITVRCLDSICIASRAALFRRISSRIIDNDLISESRSKSGAR